MKYIECPICKKKYNNERILFTLTNVNNKWINACPWCFEKSINEPKSEDENINEVFNNYTK